MRISTSLLTILAVVPCFALPLAFERRDDTHFLARLPGGTAELRPDRVSLGDVTLRFLGANATSSLEGAGKASPSTYLRAGLARTFAQFPRLTIHGLYAGVDATFYGSGENLEYDLQLADSTSISKLRISVEGSRDLRIDSQGNLSIHTSSGVLEQMRPRVFQRGRLISARYVLLNAHAVGLRLGKHDARSPLTIDPVLALTKTFGSTGYNSANQLATDAQGNIYVAGQSSGVDFPTTSNSFEPSSAPTLRVLSNAGQTINPLRVGTATSVSTVGATPDGRILYAATPQGILLSGDGGATWRKTSPLPAGNRASSGLSVSTAIVNSISLDAQDPATVLVATNAGLFGTNSGGQLWGLRNTGLNESGSGFVSVVSAFYNPLNPYIAYAITSGPSYLFASSDAGNTWRRLEPTYPGEPPAPTFTFSPNLAATQTSDGGVLYVINGNGTLLKSPDGGTSWIKLAQGFLSPLTIQLDPSNGATIYVVDYSGLHKSTDGGLTFAKAASGLDVRTLAVDSSGSVYAGNLGSAIFVSTDGAQTFTAVPNVMGVSGATLTASGSKVFVGSNAPFLPFVMKLDPTGTNILYSTFLGGSLGDGINGLAVDSQGNAVLAGTMISPDYPLTVPASNPPAPGRTDWFLTKLSADGTRLIYSTAVAASQSVTIQAVALDTSGAVFVTGQSFSADLPTTPNVVQPTLPSTACSRPQGFVVGPPIPLGNAFVSKISADGKSLVYSTFLTGSCGSRSQTITVDPAGDAIVGGYTPSPDFPASANSYQPAFPGPADQPSPPAIQYAGFVTKISPAGDKILASTFLGGGYDTQANSVALDASGNAYVTGFTQGFAPGATAGVFQTKVVDVCTPTVNIGFGPPYTGTGDAFVLKLDPAFSAARFLTYLGGGCSDSGSRIGLDQDGNIWVAGISGSSDFPLKDPFQVTALASSTPGFVSELSADGSQLLFSSFSEGTGLAVGPTSVFVAGSSSGSAFVSKIDRTKAPAIDIDSVRPVAAFQPPTLNFFSGVAPGELIQITGRNLGPATKVSAQLDLSGRLPFVLGNTVVFFDNIPAPLLSVESSSITCFVPFELISTAKITVLFNGQLSQAAKTGVVASAPQILTVVNQDGTINSADHPAKVGSVIALYVSGLGQTNPPGDDGLVNAAPLPAPLATVTVFFPLTPSFAPEFVGAAPGMIAGITQVNVRLPASTPVSGSKPIAISVSGAYASLYTTQ